jgi:Glycosyl transferase family 2
MSAIVLVHSRFEEVEQLLEHLSAQDCASSLEIVLVGERDFPLDVPCLSAFGARLRVRKQSVPSSAARATGIRAASAPIVVFVEDHCFPEPGWASALLSRYEQGDWSAVGPVVLSANPGLLADMNLHLEYGEFAGHNVGTYHHLPGHNSSYRREVLLDLGERLDQELQAESTMHWRLGKEGHRFYVEPEARVRHYTYSLWWPSLQLRFFSGWVFAANRMAGWTLWRRLAYLFASPLIPWVRLIKISRMPHERFGLPQYLATLLLVLVDGLGELMGYASGSTETPNDYFSRTEYQRAQNLSTHDRALFFNDRPSIIR